jgi:hypothetical protein
MDPLDKSQSITKFPIPEIVISPHQKVRSTERSIVSPKRVKTPKQEDPVIEYRLEEYN